MLLISFESSMRIAFYVQDIWKNQIGIYFYVIVFSALVSLFCFFALLFSGRMLDIYNRHKIYRIVLLVLTSGIFCFAIPNYFFFLASLQIITAWGCSAISCWGLQKYDHINFLTSERIYQRPKTSCAKPPNLLVNVLVRECNKGTIFFSQEQIAKRMLSYSVVLLLLFLSLLYIKNTNPEFLSSRQLQDHFNSVGERYCKESLNEISTFSVNREIDISEHLGNMKDKYTRTGAVTFVVKNKKCFIRYNVEALAYCNHGVPFFGFGAIYNKAKKVTQLKKDIIQQATVMKYLKSPDPDAFFYDGINNYFFQRIIFE